MDLFVVTHEIGCIFLPIALLGFDCWRYASLLVRTCYECGSGAESTYS